MTNTRVNEIDLLRFLAALAVVFFHYAFRGYAADAMSVMPYPSLASISKYGYLGVQLFFMISGFVILMTAANGSLRDFIISRLVRLYPAFWACCTITSLLIVAIGAPNFKVSLSQYLINMTMLSEYIGVPSIDGVYWSLFVEMKFYVLVCLILLVGRIHQVQGILILWLIASIITLPIHSYRLTYYLIADYSAFFIAGATFFLIWSKGFSLARFWIIALSWGLAVYQSIADLPNFEKNYHVTMNRSLVIGVVTIFFVTMMCVSLRKTGAFGRSRWVIVGAITYPLYLLHQNIGFMIFNTIYPKINANLLFWGTIFLMLVTAYAVHILIEKRLASSMKITIDRFFCGAGWKKAVIR
ncbi:Peptidoglycan/LPS O-acetylase OafA/YrhL, contains acyltransferase and SGNH-hydrolase domains [Polaromonas sp. OV174]|nr:Peptidoglycan/LPS O-acetylase OafA/YrhL, contains acyltransferase and SGNH-hydrolase domains [Polaromonas sp. OV174]